MKGTYCLLIKLDKDSEIKVGNRLKEIKFKKGYYIYIGSAMNSLESRLKRHLSNDKKKHWHIDYLLLDENTEVEEIILNISENKIECMLASEISKGEKNIERFGSSDCNCSSHLVYFKNKEEAIEKIKKAYKSIDMDYEIFTHSQLF